MAASDSFIARMSLEPGLNDPNELLLVLPISLVLADLLPDEVFDDDDVPAGVTPASVLDKRGILNPGFFSSKIVRLPVGRLRTPTYLAPDLSETLSVTLESFLEASLRASMEVTAVPGLFPSLFFIPAGTDPLSAGPRMASSTDMPDLDAETSFVEPCFSPDAVGRVNELTLTFSVVERVAGRVFRRLLTFAGSFSRPEVAPPAIILSLVSG